MAATTGRQVKQYVRHDVGDFSHAVLGCYVHDDHGNLYAVTAKHVTEAAGRAVFALSHQQKPVEFGQPILFGDGYFLKDIGLFRIKSSEIKRCNTAFTNAQGFPCPMNVFQGCIESLFDKELFVRTSIIKKEDVSIESSNAPQRTDDTSNGGKIFKAVLKRAVVATEEVHVLYSSSVDTAYSFLVVSSDECPLIGGDSGSILFLQNEDGSVELVGVLGGAFSERTPSGSGRHSPSLERGDAAGEASFGSLVKCTLLHSGLFRNEKAGLRLKLAECNSERTRRVLKRCFRTRDISSDTSIAPGDKVFTKRFKMPNPSKLRKRDFDLLEQIGMLVRGFGDDPETPSLEQENNFITFLTDCLYARKSITADAVCHESADQMCFYNSMLSCERIYGCEFTEAEDLLKDAYRAVIKADMKQRLLCKMIQLASLLWLRSDKFKHLAELFDVSKEFMAEMNTTDLESSRCVGYYYMNFAWYFSRMGRKEFSLELARKSYTLFLQYRDLDGQGPGLACVLLARLMLGCGEFLDTVDTRVTQDDIETAETILQATDRGDRTDIPVLGAHYSLALSELRLRRGDVCGAIREAEKCLTIAKANNIGDSARQANAHIAKLIGMPED